MSHFKALFELRTVVFFFSRFIFSSCYIIQCFKFVT